MSGARSAADDPRVRSRISRAAGALLLGALACSGPPVPEIETEGMEPAVAEAIRSSEAALREDRRDADRWGALAMTLHAHGLAEEAANAYRIAAERNGDDHRWPHLRARLLEAGAPADALPPADRAIALCPDFVPSLALRARLLDALGGETSDSGARAAWERVLEADPDSAEALAARGRALAADGDLEAARAALERATRLAPDSQAGWALFAAVLARLGRSDEAESAAGRARAAARSPTGGRAPSPDPLLAGVEELRADRRGREIRARRASERGEHGEAEAIYRDLLRSAPEPGVEGAALHWGLGNALSRDGRTEEAEAAYREALENDPDFVPAMSNLANLLAREGRDREAEALYSRSRSADPDHVPTLLGASSLRFQRGDVSGAEELLREALRREPDHPAALQGLGQLQASAGAWSDAAGTLARALEVAERRGADPRQQAGLHFLLADVASRRGRREEALRHLRSAESLGMTIPPAFRTEIERGGAPDR